MDRSGRCGKQSSNVSQKFWKLYNELTKTAIKARYEPFSTYKTSSVSPLKHPQQLLLHYLNEPVS